MTFDTVRRAADNLFRRPDAEAGSNAEKLQAVRRKLQVRRRELRDTQRQDREGKRSGQPALS